MILNADQMHSDSKTPTRDVTTLESFTRVGCSCITVQQKLFLVPLPDKRLLEPSASVFPLCRQTVVASSCLSVCSPMSLRLRVLLIACIIGLCAFIMNSCCQGIKEIYLPLHNKMKSVLFVLHTQNILYIQTIG